ncbi:MAG: hypothetical protein LBQ72_01805 [Flavobacteriales bacterium]|jgi:lipopolysaccharide export system protein LptA|uniref:OstA-like protein n=1 Tax=Blattabacterium sp. (Mastotermes darwiniensis) TaxID=39768 RepID=UPI000231DF3B|nr:OstA-like protein [Blattabacterium sp. (Mastotermes darwiniensis)]AER40344.1 hypothetical protein MADAR_016 [Blattabacterium sp. (Mastotermes darwiniensis) str. MADAR]MDR1804935.1 hypothetical protein [Flavobacteriales bacterium]
MNTKYLFLLVFLLLFFLNFNKGYSFFKKNKNSLIRIIHSDFIQKKEKLHDDAFFFIGHVHFQYNGYQLFCDKAIYERKNNRFYGYGNVQLKSYKKKFFSHKIEFSKNFENIKASGKVILLQNNIKLTADVINYNFRKKIFQAIKNVFLILDKLRLSTNILEYNLRLKKFSYKKGGFISYRNYFLYSQEGFFFPIKKRALLKNKVKLISKYYTVYSNSMECLFPVDKITFFSHTIMVDNKNRDNFFYTKGGFFLIKKEIFLSKKYCSIHYNGKIVQGDYLFYNHKKKYGLIKNVFLEDPKKGYSFMGKNGYFDFNSGLFSLKKDTIAVVIKKDSKKDPIFIYSDIIKINFQKNSTYLIQFFSVQGIFLNEELQGKSDSLVYNPSKNYIQFYGNPIFWLKDQQITGNSIYMKLKKNIFSLDFFKIIKNASYIKKIDSEIFNQIQGKIVTGFFGKKNLLERILIQGNIQGIIFSNQFYCENLYIDLKNGNDVKRIFCLEKANSELFKKKEKNSLLIPLFSWREKEQPTNKKYLFYNKMKKFRQEILLEKKEIKKIFYERIRE